MDVIEELKRDLRDAASAGGIHFGAGVCATLATRLETEVSGGKQQWDTLAAMLGADGDNVDEVYQRAMTVLLVANTVAVLTEQSSETLAALVPSDAAYFEKLRTLQDAQNYRYIRDAFDGMKTSTSERFLECLKLDGDAWLPLDTLMFGAKAAKAFKRYQVEFVLYASVRPDGETWESMNISASDMVAAEATFFRQVGGEALVYKHFTKELP